MHVFLRFTWNTQQKVGLLHKPGVKTTLKAQNWQEKMSPYKVIHSCMLCHYKLAGPLLFLLFLWACICVNSSTTAGVCEVNGILLGCTGLRRGYWCVDVFVYWFEKKLSKWKVSILLWYWLLSAENFIGKMLTLAPLKKKLYLGSNISGWDVLSRLVWKRHTLLCVWTIINSLYTAWLTLQTVWQSAWMTAL